MSWNPHMEVHYINTGLPYSSTGSFMDFFEGLTYDHVNFIFADAPYAQVTLYNVISCFPLYLLVEILFKAKFGLHLTVL